MWHYMFIIFNSHAVLSQNSQMAKEIEALFKLCFWTFINN